MPKRKVSETKIDCKKDDDEAENPPARKKVIMSGDGGGGGINNPFGRAYMNANQRAAALLGEELMRADTEAKWFPMQDREIICPREFIVLNGRRNTGKSWWIRDFLYEFRHVFAYGYIFTHTKHNGFYQQFYPNALIMEKFDSDVMETIFEIQKSRVHVRGESTEVFVLFDDIISDRHINYANIFVKLATEGRHYNITVILASQYYKGIGPIMRLNADKVVMFDTTSRRVLEALADEFGCNDFIDRANFYAWFKKHTQDDHTVVINCKRYKDKIPSKCDRWFTYKARDLSDTKFTLLCDRAWKGDKGKKAEEQRKFWKLPDMPADSTYKRMRSQSVVTTDQARGQTAEAKRARHTEPFGFISQG